MEDRALSTLKVMLTERGLKGEIETLGSDLADAKLYSFGTVLIVFSTKTRVSANDLSAFIKYSQEKSHSSSLIIVAYSKPSDAVLLALRDHISQKDVPLVQLFEIRHLQLLYGHHKKVPKHRILKDAEINEIFKTPATKETLYRKIDSQDPMAKWVGARPGDILEVTGMCETSAENKRHLFCMADVTNG